MVYRFGDHWASVELGRGLTIGLHPAREVAAAEARKGVAAIGLELTGRIGDAMRTLEGRGVRFHGVADEGKAGKFAHFENPDGNTLYPAELNWKYVDQWQGQYPRG